MHKAHRKICPKTETALKPSDVARAYGFPTGVDLSKRTVAILELGGAFQLSDVVSYCQREGYKVPQITTVYVDGAAEAQSQADGEVCLDLDVIAGVAQGCKIIVVFAPNSDSGFIDGLAKCVELDPDSISISWGSPENSWDPASMAKLDELMQQAAEKGIAVFCASGDNGSSDGASGDKNCDYPASSPFAIACGGTSLQLNADGSRASETAWSSTGVDVLGNVVGSDEGSGGGISSFYSSTPNWQSGVLPNEPSGRRSPDISGNADPNTGYQVDIDGQMQQIGGTSAVAPLYAALHCMINEIMGAHVGNLHTKLYLNAGSGIVFDVTEGTNGAYQAGPGYDCVTGLGVINAEQYIDVLKQTGVSVTAKDESNPITDADNALMGEAEKLVEKAFELIEGSGFKDLPQPVQDKLKASLVKAQANGTYGEIIAVAQMICTVGGKLCPIVNALPSTLETKN